MEYIYKYELNNYPIYIGITSNIKERASQHGKLGDNIDESGWDEINSSDLYYATMPNRIMADCMESILIQKYKPKYNKDKKCDWEGLDISEPKWHLFNRNYLKTDDQINDFLQSILHENDVKKRQSLMRSIAKQYSQKEKDRLNQLLNKYIFDDEKANKCILDGDGKIVFAFPYIYNISWNGNVFRFGYAKEISKEKIKEYINSALDDMLYAIEKI